MKYAGKITDIVRSTANKHQFKPFNINLGSGTSVIAPEIPVGSDGSVNIMFQFRGGVTPIAEKSNTNAIIIMADAGGVGGGQSRAKFGNTAFINSNISKILEKLKQTYGRDVHLGYLGLSAWSGGYDAIHGILEEHFSGKRLIKDPDYVGLFDGMHHSSTQALDVWKKLADMARGGSTQFTIVHTAVKPQGYPSTTDNSNWLLQQEDMQRVPVQNWNGQGIAPESLAESGGFRVYQLYSRTDPYQISGRANVPGTSGWQHIQALQSIPDYWPSW